MSQLERSLEPYINAPNPNLMLDNSSWYGIAIKNIELVNIDVAKLV